MESSNNHSIKSSNKEAEEINDLSISSSLSP